MKKAWNTVTAWWNDTPSSNLPVAPENLAMGAEKAGDIGANITGAFAYASGAVKYKLKYETGHAASIIMAYMLI